MSLWHVNDAWLNFYPFDGGRVIYVDCSQVRQEFVLDTRDALSEPDVGSLLLAGLALWPRGSAWGAPGMEAPGEGTALARLTRAILAPFAGLYRRAWQLTLESRAATLIDSLDDWELDYGLPDKCVTEPQSFELRLLALKTKVARSATITPADVVRLAAELGFVTAVEEPEPFRLGETALGAGELAGAPLGQQWVVHIHDAPSWRFEVGISEVGSDRLLDFDSGPISCAIERIAPAWSMPVISVAPLPHLIPLVTEEDVLLVTENGELIAILGTLDP